jgi:hypothetical protein
MRLSAAYYRPTKSATLSSVIGGTISAHAPPFVG